MSTAADTLPKKERRLSQEVFEKKTRDHLDALRDRRGGSTGAPGVERVRAGLDVEALDKLLGELDLTQEELAPVIGVSARTLQRRRAEDGSGRLTPMESDRLWRLLHVWERACCAFDDPASARDWLYEPSALLGGEAPGAHLDTEPGLREVEDMLTVIDETGTA